jgi:hypothetical protein
MNRRIRGQRQIDLGVLHMYPNETLHLRVGLLHHWAIYVTLEYHRVRLAYSFRNAFQQENPLCILMKTIIRVLMHHVKQDRHTNRQSDGQSTDIDDAVKLISKNTPNGDTEVIKRHMIYSFSFLA